MKAILIERQETYIQCPSCDDQTGHRATNLTTGATFDPSYCRCCGAGITGRRDGDGRIEIELTGEEKVPAYLLVHLEPGEMPLMVMVQAPPDDLRGGAAEANEDATSGGDLPVGGAPFASYGAMRAIYPRNVECVVRPDALPGNGSAPRSSAAATETPAED